MKITWLGQAGFLFEKDDIKIIVDPYLSDSVEKKLNPKSVRHQKIDESFLKINPDIIVITHNHLDHCDPDTLKHYLTDDSEVTVLCPKSVWQSLRKHDKNNYVQFDRGTEFTVLGIRFEAVLAVHSDDFAIGCIIDDGSKKHYITGDTLYNKEIFKDIPNDVFAVFMPVNGTGNNMNIHDAKRFAEIVGAKHSIPVHFGMFDNLVPTGFETVPEIYKEIVL